MKKNDASGIMVSVIVPIYNAEDTLDRCIGSVLKQTFNDYELILVNDGSDDNSRMIIEKYSLKDDRIVLVNQHNKGVSAARNYGIAIAKGQWITFVDADDYIMEDCLELAMNAASEIECEMVFWNRKDVYDGRIEEKRIYQSQRAEKVFSGEELIKKVLYNSEGNLELSSSCCRLFQRDIIIRKHIRFPEDLRQGEDMMFMIDYLMSVSKVLYCDFFAYCRVMRGQSAMHQFNPVIKEHMLHLLEHLKERVELIKDRDIEMAYSVYVFRGPVTGVLESLVCHKDNENSYLERCGQLKEFIEIPIVKDAIGRITYSELPVRLQIKLFCIRHKLLFVLDKWYQNKNYI